MKQRQTKNLRDHIAHGIVVEGTDSGLRGLNFNPSSTESWLWTLVASLVKLELKISHASEGYCDNSVSKSVKNSAWYKVSFR